MPIKTALLLALMFAGPLKLPAQNNNLNYYEQKAFNNSALLKDIRNQLLMSRLDSAKIRAVYKPQIGLTSGAYIAPVLHGYGYDGSVTNIQTLYGLLNINQSLDSRQYIRAQLNTVRLQADSLQNTSKINEQDLKRLVDSQYITAYGSLQQLQFNRKVDTLLQRENEILIKLTRQNVYRQTDYLTFLVTLKQQNLQLQQSLVQFKSDFAGLNYLAGIQDTMTVNLQDPKIGLAVLPPPSASIFFRQYSLDSLRLINDRRIIGFTYRPRAGVFTNGGYNTAFISPVYNNFGVAFGFSLSLPVYDGHQRKLLYKRLTLQEETRQNYKAFFTVQYNQQLAQLRQQISGNEALISQINDQLKYSERLVTVDFELMQTGDLRVADLILAINNYLNARYLLTQTNISRLQLITQFNYWNR